MRAITELGYEKPSPIQVEALPILLGDPTDFVGLAATGTGKTAAFGIPLLERIDPNKRAVQALILCPTRELAVQVSGQINLLGKYKNIKSFPIYGGAGYGDQIAAIRRGVNVIVGTPGRLVDHLNKGTLRLDELEVLVLDEADEMISMGFKDDLEAILEQTPQGEKPDDATCNIWLFSATMSSEVRRVADKYLREPQQVQINRKEMLSGTVEQLYYITQESNKPEVLCKLLDAAEDFYGLVFCQTKSLVTDLVRYMADRGYKVDCLHGDMDQKAREKTMQSFRDRKVTLLICTDVASRGLDVKDITHVINYSLPRELDNYVHRIGRTGRSGKTGIAMSLVTQSHRQLVGRIEKMTKSRMTEGKVPTRREIGAKKIASSLTRFEADTSYTRALEIMTPAWKAAVAEMDPTEVAARFLAIANPEVFGDGEKSAPSNNAYLGRSASTDSYGDRSSGGYGGNDRGDRGDRNSGGGYGRDRFNSRGGSGEGRGKPVFNSYSSNNPRILQVGSGSPAVVIANPVKVATPNKAAAPVKTPPPVKAPAKTESAPKGAAPTKAAPAPKAEAAPKRELAFNPKDYSDAPKGKKFDKKKKDKKPDHKLANKGKPNFAFDRPLSRGAK
jgi:ATP-dependent RNA helicase DeaD